MKKNFSRHRLKGWLRSVTGVTLLSISLANDVTSIITNTSSPKFIASAMEKNLESFPKGTYIVEYEYCPEDDGQDDIPYNKTVVAMAYDANVAADGKILHLSKLLLEIGDYEYFISSKIDTGAYKLYTIFVKQPEDPFHLENLLVTLNKQASFVAIDDGSRKITSSNSFINGRKWA